MGSSVRTCLSSISAAAEIAIRRESAACMAKYIAGVSHMEPANKSRIRSPSPGETPKKCVRYGRNHVGIRIVAKSIVLLQEESHSPFFPGRSTIKSLS